MQLLVDTFADVKDNATTESEDGKEEKKETWLDKLKHFFYD